MNLIVVFFVDACFLEFHCNKVMCAYDLYIDFQKMNITSRTKMVRCMYNSRFSVVLLVLQNVAFQSKIKKAVEMKSQLISDYYKHEQDQLETSGYSNVFETYRNFLVCHLLHQIKHFRVTRMDCLPRFLLNGYRHLYPGGKVAGA